MSTRKPKESRRFSLARIRDALKRRIGRQSSDVWGVLLIVVGVVLALSLVDAAGPLGRLAASSMKLLFGLWAYAVPVLLAAVGSLVVAASGRRDIGRVVVGLTVTFVGSLAFFHLLTGTVSLARSVDLVRERGGAVGSLLAFPLRRVVGFWGAFVVLVAVTAVGTLTLTRATIRDLGSTLLHGWKALRGFAGRTRSARSTKPTVVRGATAAVRDTQEPPRPKPTAPPPRPPKSSPDAKNTKPRHRRPPIPEPKTGEGYRLPPLELLRRGKTEGHSRRVLEQTAADLEATIVEHGVDARLTRIVPGPTVTRYEIELAPGVKVSRVTSLASDIAYALATPDVRLLAPIPGRSAIGVEVPNRRRHLVTLGDVLGSPEARAAQQPLAVGLGADISGNPRLLDLAELPHVLIAGATGAGKSSCINAIVTSLIMRTHPDDVRLILVDPKRVELGQYNGVPHLLTRVITNPKKAVDSLEWAVGEMERRYELLAEAGVRDIISYREHRDAGALDAEAFDRFPYIVVVVDELNDLMMVAGKAVESAVVRLAQMARAVGVHLVLATQRPSVDVITGVIKANIPSRLAFSVASQTDSRVILDQVGADKLVGLGDMLVVTAREPRPVRIQGSWVTEEEIHSVAEWVRQQRKAEYKAETLVAPVPEGGGAGEDFEGEDAEMMREALDLIVRSQLGSTSMLQRKLRIGFARAGRVMDILERRGIVGPSQGSKAREVLVTVEELDEILGVGV